MTYEIIDGKTPMLRHGEKLILSSSGEIIFSWWRYYDWQRRVPTHKQQLQRQHQQQRQELVSVHLPWQMGSVMGHK